MKVGDLAWFDAFYHKNCKSATPRDYAVPCMIIKEYTSKEKTTLVGDASVNSERVYDILIEEKVYLAPEGTLVLMYRSEEI